MMLLGLLDHSSAYDVVDHKILLRRLEISYGICGLPLQWITSYLSGRTQYVQFSGKIKTSEVTLITCGIPQGSVLGPLLFIVYTAEVIDVMVRFGYAVHVYADDLQLHTHVDPPDSPEIVRTFSDCVEAVKDCMSSNRLKLNPSKIIIWLGSSRQLWHCPMGLLQIAEAWITPLKHVRDLGVIIDSDLSMSTHIRTTIRNCYFHLRQLCLARHSLSKEAAHALVRATIHCRLDYCNSVLSNQLMYVYNNLQLVLLTAAHLIVKLPGAGLCEQNWSYEERSALVGVSPTDQLQTVHFDIQVFAWHGSGILDEAFHSCLFSRWTLTLEVCCRWSSRRPDHENKNNRNKKFPLFGSCSLEQSFPSIAWLFSDFWKFQKTSENLLVLNWLTPVVHYVHQCDVLH